MLLSFISLSLSLFFLSTFPFSLNRFIFSSSWNTSLNEIALLHFPVIVVVFVVIVIVMLSLSVVWHQV